MEENVPFTVEGEKERDGRNHCQQVEERHTWTGNSKYVTTRAAKWSVRRRVRAFELSRPPRVRLRTKKFTDLSCFVSQYLSTNGDGRDNVYVTVWPADGLLIPLLQAWHWSVKRDSAPGRTVEAVRPFLHWWWRLSGRSDRGPRGHRGQLVSSSWRHPTDRNRATQLDSREARAHTCTRIMRVNVYKTRMWAGAQRDGRPAEYRWRPLFIAAKFGWRPLLECCAVTLPRRETRWNLLGCPKLGNRSQPLVDRSSPYYEVHCCLTSFFPIVNKCLSCEDSAR